MTSEFPPRSVRDDQPERTEIAYIRERAIRHSIPPSAYQAEVDDLRNSLIACEAADADPRWVHRHGDDSEYNEAMRPHRERLNRARRAALNATAAPHVDLPQITPSAEQIAESQARIRHRPVISIGIFSERLTPRGFVEQSVRLTEAGPRRVVSVVPLPDATPQVAQGRASIAARRVRRLCSAPRGARACRVAHRVARRAEAASASSDGAGGEEGPEPPAFVQCTNEIRNESRTARWHFDSGVALIARRRYEAASHRLRLVLPHLANVADQGPEERRGPAWAARAHVSALVELIADNEIASLSSHISQAAAYLEEAEIDPAVRVRP